MDLLVIEREPFGERRNRFAESRRIRRAVARFKVPNDILVCSADEVAFWQDTRNHIVAEALRRGRVLYARP